MRLDMREPVASGKKSKKERVYMDEHLTCKTGLKKGLITKEVFDREIALCKNLSHEAGKCSWGVCENCGVIPMLYKLHKGQLIETPEELQKIREKVFK